MSEKKDGISKSETPCLKKKTAFPNQKRHVWEKIWHFKIRNAMSEKKYGISKSETPCPEKKMAFPNQKGHV